VAAVVRCVNGPDSLLSVRRRVSGRCTAPGSWAAAQQGAGRL